MNRSWQFSQLRFHIFFFIGLESPQDYDRPIRRAGGVLFKILGRGLAGSGGVKLATKKSRNIIGDKRTLVQAPEVIYPLNL